MKRKIFALTVMLILIVFSFSVNTTAVEEEIHELSAPVIQFPTEPTNGTVTVTITTQDSMNEETKLYYCIAEGEWTEYTQAFSVFDNTEISAKAVSENGVQSSLVIAEITCIDKIAPTAPTIVPKTTAWTNAPQSITLVSGTDAQSGYLRTEYRIGSEGTWIEYYGEFTVNTECVVYARTVDRASNCSDEVSMSIANFDFTPPDISTLSVTFGSEHGVSIYGTSSFSSFFTGSVTCSVDGAADSQSGVAYYEYQLVESGAYVNDAAWHVYDPDNKPVFSRDFIGNVYARAVDNAGNASKYIPSAGIVLDNTAPIIENVKKSTSAITDESVVVTFEVTDNISILNVTVNGEYVGIYAPVFTAFRNGEYVIIARDKAGNETTETVVISNIQTTPFDILRVAKSLDENDYTPTSWNNMQKYMTELDNLISVQSDESVINSAAEQLTTALEALVRRGDGTYARELLERAANIDKEAYTDTSRKRVENAMSTLSAVLENSESSQQDIDEAQATLENFMTGLVLNANFTSLDRIISTVRGIDPTPYPQERYELLMSKVAEAEQLVRTDTDQETADRYYSEILTLMGELNINKLPDEEERVSEGINLIHVMIAIVAVLAIALTVAIILIIKRAPDNKSEDMAYYYEASSRRENYETAEEFNRNGNTRNDDGKPASFGDIQFGDEGEFNNWE